MALLVQFPLTIRAKRNGLINEPGRQFYLLYTHLMVSIQALTIYIQYVSNFQSSQICKRRICFLFDALKGTLFFQPHLFMGILQRQLLKCKKHKSTMYVYTQSTTVYVPSLKLGPPTHSPEGVGWGSPNSIDWVKSLDSTEICKQSMGARNRVRIGLSYRPAWIHRLHAKAGAIDSLAP